MIQEGVGIEKETGKLPRGREMIMVNDRQLQGFG